MKYYLFCINVLTLQHQKKIQIMKKLLLLTMLLLSSNGLKAQTAMDIASEMYPGINLGNTLEACPCDWLSNKLDWETGWQRTRTTQKIIDYMKSLGFRSVRIPTSWYMHSDANHTIDKAWMDRVQEIVDYCINDSLYVVLNDHWDNGWVENSFGDLTDKNIKEKSAIMTTLWSQIAERFKDYDHHLLFAGLNEPNAGDDTKKIAALIKYEQAFIDAVRATGGNNAKRILVVQGSDTNIEHSYNYMDIDDYTDPTPSALMFEVHFYGPYNFVMMTEDASWGKMAYYWGTGNSVSGSSRNSTWGDEQWVYEQLKMMRNKFARKGVPVIIGEYAAEWRTLPAGENQDKHNASIKAWYKTVTKYAISCGCIPMVWDTNNGKGIINRTRLTIDCPYAMEGINEGVADSRWSYASSIPDVTDSPATPHHRTYNLQGMEVGDDYEGIVIRNGKKIFMSKK